MVPLMAFAVLLVIAGIVFVVTAVSARSHRPEQLLMAEQERSELEGLRCLVDDLRETAWSHRELDSDLSTIILDEIRTYEHRRQRGLE